MSRYLSLLWLTLLTLPDNAKVLRPIFRSTLFLVLSAAIAACSGTTGTESVSLADPFVGTGFHGHTYPGATAPFGMVQLSPDTRNRTWDGSSGYHYSDPTILGFSHTHLSGTGCADCSTEDLCQLADRLEAFRTAYNEAIGRINADPESFLDLFYEKANVAEPLQGRYTVPSYTPDCVPSLEDVARIQDFMVNKGLLEEPFSYEDMVADLPGGDA